MSKVEVDSNELAALRATARAATAWAEAMKIHGSDTQEFRDTYRALRDAVTWYRTAAKPETCPYGHPVSDEPGECLPGSCGWR